MLRNIAAATASRHAELLLCRCCLPQRQTVALAAAGAAAAAAKPAVAPTKAVTPATSLQKVQARAGARPGTLQPVSCNDKCSQTGRPPAIWHHTCCCCCSCRHEACSSDSRFSLREARRSINTLFSQLPPSSPAAISANGVTADAASLQQLQQSLANQIVKACEYYGIRVQQQQQQQDHAAGLRVGVLLPPSPVALAAVAAIAAIDGVAALLPFCDAAVAAETAAAATAAAGGVAAAGGAAARPLAAAVEENGGEMFCTRPNACSSSVISGSKNLRLLQQQLAEARTQLLLVHPALAAAAAALCEQLGVHVCICSAAAPAATDICLQQQQQQQAATAAETVRLFVKKGRTYSRSLAVRTKWVPLCSSDGGPLGPLRELKDALAAAEGACSNSSSSSNSSSRSDTSRRASSADDSSSSSCRNLQSSSVWSLLVEASRCWGQPRKVLLPAVTVKQQLQRNAEQLLQYIIPGHTAVVAAAAAAITKSKLLMAVIFPLLQRQSSVLLLTRKPQGPVPLPLQVALEQQAADAAAAALSAETASARAAAAWHLLLQRQTERQQQQQWTLAMDLETATAMLDIYERAAAAARAPAAARSALAVASEDLVASAAELAAAARQRLSCCIICTDEGDVTLMAGQTPQDSSSNASSSTTVSTAVAEALPAARVAATIEGWQQLLPTTAAVLHVLTITEVGVVAVQRQQGNAADGAVPPAPQERASAAPAEAATAEPAAAAAGQEMGVALGQLVPGVAAATAENGILLFSSSSKSSSTYFGRPVATADAFGGPGALGAQGAPAGWFFRSALLGRVDEFGTVHVTGCTYSLAQQQPLQRPLQQRLQQWQWGLPRMERLIEGYVHKVPISGKEWGNYHAKKRHWKRMF